MASNLTVLNCKLKPIAPFLWSLRTRSNKNDKTRIKELLLYAIFRKAWIDKRTADSGQINPLANCQQMSIISSLVHIQCNVKVWDDKKSCIFFEKFYYIARLDNTFHTLVIWGQIRLYSSNPFSAIRYENPLCTKSHSETCYKRDLVATSSTNLYVFLPRKHN